MPRKRESEYAPAQKTGMNLVGFQAGPHCIVSGASGRGKTEYVVDAILGKGVHAEYEGPWNAVMIMCDNISIDQPAFKRLKKHFKGPILFHEGLPMNQDEEDDFINKLKKLAHEKYKTICIIDDLMTSTRSGSAQHFVDKMFTSARHLNTSVWELTQAHTGSRTRRLNSGYLVCFATPADVKSLAHICNSIRPETKGHDILAAYRVATESHNGHGCLVICLQQPNEFMFRNTSMSICFDMNSIPVDGNGVPHVGGFY
jgi:hypothetical protein